MEENGRKKVVGDKNGGREAGQSLMERGIEQLKRVKIEYIVKNQIGEVLGYDIVDLREWGTI